MINENRPMGINGEPLWLPGMPLDKEGLIAVGATEFEARILENESMEFDIPDNEIEQIMSDHRIVEESIESVNHLENKIIFGKATNKEISSWYKRNDPLHLRRVFDDFVVNKISELAEPIDEELRHRALVLENGGETIILNTLTPGWVSKNLNTDPNAHELANAPMDLLQLSIYAIDEFKSQKFPISQLQDFIIAADMIDEYTKIINDDKLISLPDGYNELIHGYKLAILDFVDRNGVCKDEKDWIIKGDAFTRYASEVFFGLTNIGATNEKFEEVRSKLLIKLISEFEDITANITTKSNKGFIHEYLWILDSMMYAHLNNTENMFVVPSKLYEDEPVTGETKYNRAYDIRLGINGGDVKLIQLKSSTKDWGKVYHDGIVVIKEEEFNSQPSRIRTKLKVYKKILANEVENKNEIFKEYALPSVIKTIHQFLAENEFKNWKKAKKPF